LGKQRAGLCVPAAFPAPATSMRRMVSRWFFSRNWVSVGRDGPPQTETKFPVHAAVGPRISKRISVMCRLHAKKALTSGRRKGIGAKSPQCPLQAGHHVSSLHKAILGLQQAVPAPAGSRGPKKPATTRTHRVKMSRNPSDGEESRTTHFAKKSALFHGFFTRRATCGGPTVQPLPPHQYTPTYGVPCPARALHRASAPCQCTGRHKSPKKIIFPHPCPPQTQPGTGVGTSGGPMGR
jgi:hypothetical protein